MATSDIHGKMLPYDYGMDEESESGSLAQVSSAIKEFRTENTIVVDAGDLIQGNFMEIFTQDEIHPMVQAINLIGYDACPEIDVIVAAHEHKQIPGTEENGVLIVENENGGQSLARVNLVLEKDGDGEYQIEERISESIEISDYEPNIVTVREEDILK